MSKKISQVDFVPTFSLLMGLPIPFSNVGKVIQDVFIPFGPRQLQYLKINIDQVFNYLSKYQNAVGSTGKLPNFDGIEEKRRNFMNKTVLKPSEVPSDFSIGIELLDSVKLMVQSMFIDFDLRHIYDALYISCLWSCLMVVLSLDKIFLRSVVTGKLFLSLGALLLALASLW